MPITQLLQAATLIHDPPEIVRYQSIAPAARLCDQHVSEANIADGLLRQSLSPDNFTGVIYMVMPASDPEMSFVDLVEQNQGSPGLNVDRSDPRQRVEGRVEKLGGGMAQF
ncbi:hypothetical protein MY1884_006733 [Beauveria asiatica]